MQMKKVLVIFLTLITGLVLVACSNGTNDDTDINVYTRDTTSGTRGAFFEIIGLDDLAGSNEDLATGFVEVSSNGDMLSSVRNDVNAIGYVSLASLTADLKALAYNGVEASVENVLDDSYTLKRPFMYIQKDLDDIENADEKALLAAFVAFMATRDGLEIIKNNDGIVDIPESAKLWDDIKAEHPIVESTGADIEIHFGGSTSVEKIARALSETFSSLAPRFKPIHAHAGSGAAFTGTRPDGTLHMGFASRELKENEQASIHGRIAFDAVVIVVNENNNSISNITTEQVGKVFKGETTSWNELG